MAEKLKTLRSIARAVNDKAGKVIMGCIGDDPGIEKKLTIQYIPTACRELNSALGGGFPKGRCTIITGKPDSGKTSMVLETVALAMRNDPNFVCCWLESENSLNKDYIVKTFGIDGKRFFLVMLDKDGAEYILNKIHGIMGTGVIDLFCINSLRCLTPSKEFEANFEDATVAVQARLNAKIVKKFNALVSTYNTAFIMIAHLSTDIGSMSRDPLVISGGHAIQYWASIILDLRKLSIGPGEIISKEDGIKIGATVRKNHCRCDANPYVKVIYYAVFGEGTEQILSCIGEAMEKGILEQHGAWLYWMQPGGEEPLRKFKSRAAFKEYMKENPDDWLLFSSSIAGEVENLSAEEIACIEKENAEMEKR